MVYSKMDHRFVDEFRTGKTNEIKIIIKWRLKRCTDI